MIRLILLTFLILSLTSCTAMNQMVNQASSVAVAAGFLSRSQADSLLKVTTSVAKTLEDITPAQEYYIGRAVSAGIVNRYPVKSNPRANRYLNLLGQTLVMASDKPSTYKGYHFLLLNTDEVVAFAAPSGFIFVSKGMIRLCRNEDDLAAVLAHEIGHVQNTHALAAISTSRITSALTIIAAESAKTLAGGTVGELTRLFEGSIDDITQTLINSGYARGQEDEADASAISIMQRIGYDPVALIRVLELMKVKIKPGASGFVSTHPDPDDRIANIKSLLSEMPLTIASNKHASRFEKFLRTL